MESLIGTFTYKRLAIVFLNYKFSISCLDFFSLLNMEFINLFVCLYVTEWDCEFVQLVFLVKLQNVDFIIYI